MDRWGLFLGCGLLDYFGERGVGVCTGLWGSVHRLHEMPDLDMGLNIISLVLLHEPGHMYTQCTQGMHNVDAFPK